MNELKNPARSAKKAGERLMKSFPGRAFGPE
jgi:hypothetical protein